jgi:hypothetical protein
MLNQIPQAGGTRTDIEPRDGTVPKLTRSEAADDAGVSEHQRKTALRVANVPVEFFEAAIENIDPITAEVQGYCCEDHRLNRRYWFYFPQ